MICLLSVPHSATRFLLNLFKHNDVGFIFTHLQSKNMPAVGVYADNGISLVVPMRNPYNVARSWLACRDRKADTFTSEELMIECWDNLINTIDKMNPLYLCVDGGNKEQQLERISDAVNKKLNTSWEVVGASEFHSQDFEYTVPNYISSFYQEKLNA